MIPDRAQRIEFGVEAFAYDPPLGEISRRIVAQRRIELFSEGNEGRGFGTPGRNAGTPAEFHYLRRDEERVAKRIKVARTSGVEGETNHGSFDISASGKEILNRVESRRVGHECGNRISPPLQFFEVRQRTDKPLPQEPTSHRGTAAVHHRI